MKKVLRIIKAGEKTKWIDLPENLSLDDVFVEGSMVEEIDESDVHLFNYKN